MNQMTHMIEDPGTDPNMKQVTTDTMKYNAAAVSGIAQNPGIAAKYGSDVNAVETLESQLQKYQAEQVFNAVINKALQTANDDASKSTHNQFDINTKMVALGLATK
jgi:hypothetical protein